MNPDNPYAAPQTIGLPSPLTLLPVAGAHGKPSPRQRLAEWDTARLTALWKRSRAIHEMQYFWFLACLITPVVGYLCSLSFGVYEFSINPTRGWIAFGCVLLTFARFGLAYVRSRIVRPFAIVMDGLLGLGCGAAIGAGLYSVSSEPGAIFPVLYVVFFALLFGWQAMQSLRAMIQAPELFGPGRISHDALADEVEERKKQQLERAKTS
jgi:hypothetical protein